MNTNALNRLIKERGTDGVLVCSECGSTEIQLHAWVDANHLTFCGDVYDDDNSSRWCEECQAHVRFSTITEFKKKMNSDMDNLSAEGERNRMIKMEWDKLPYLRKREMWAALFLDAARLGMKNKAPDLSTIRSKAIMRIKSLMNHCGLSELSVDDISCGGGPVVREDANDGNMTYTLDGITVGSDGKLSFATGNCCGDISLTEDSISTDALINIAVWMGAHEPGIVKRYFLDATENIDIDELEDILKENGATSITFVDENIDDGVDDSKDRYLMLRSYDFVFMKYKIHGRFYYGDLSRVISYVNLDIRDCNR